MEPKNTEEAKKVVESLRAALKVRFDLHGVPGLAPALSDLQERMEAGLEPLRPGEENEKVLRQVLSEVYGAAGEIELGIRHSLLVFDTGEVASGVKKSYVDAVPLPRLGPVDMLFWNYVSMTWEALYRLASRLENLINFCLFGVSGRPPWGTPRYMTELAGRIEKERPDLAKLGEFQGVKELGPKRQELSATRNDESHWASSIWSMLKVEIRRSMIVAVDGANHVNVDVTFPDAGAELAELEKLFKDFSECWIPAVYKFLLSGAGTLKKPPAPPPPTAGQK